MCSAYHSLAFLHFESPGYLALLAVLPLLVALSIRSMAGLGRVRRMLAISLRCIVVTFMILALAGAERVTSTDDISVIFLVDRSHSIPGGLQAGQFDLLKGIDEQRPKQGRLNDRFGVIAFDGQSSIEQLPMGILAIERFSAPVVPERTDIAAALRMGLALFPPGMARRLVLVSDGNENVGDVLQEADQLRAAGVPVDVFPVEYDHENEVVFERLKAPATASAEETINLQMVLRSQRATRGRIMLYHNEQIVDLDPDGPGAGYPVELDAGATRFSIPVPLRAAGAHRFRAAFEPDNPADDGVAANNTGRAFTVVSGQGRILILTPGPLDGEDYRSAEILRRALERERLVAQVEIVGEKPLDQVRLLEYSLVILGNVPANLLTREQQVGLATYVRDLGGGLVMVGGDQSFGAGGWMDSPVEEIMPVSFDVKAKKQIPKGALVLVMHACEIPKGNYWGERVAIESIKALSRLDLIGVLSYQWMNAKQGNWVIPLQPIGNKTARIQQVKKMQMGDMPSLQDVMVQGVDALVARPDAGIKHMIVISDFDPAGPTPALLKRMKDEKITCSTVAIGFGVHWINQAMAQNIATQTGGKFYRTNDFSKLPQIFLKESQVVRRSLIHEVAFTPTLTNRLSPIIAGVGSSGVPQLLGYVVTTPKPLADMPLARLTKDGPDPVLAHWQVGLGKTVAFTSGMWTRWGSDWAGWPGFSKLWAQIARWASRQSDAAAFDVTTSVQGGKGTIRIDALDKNASAINFMSVQGTLVAPDSTSRPLRLTQTGPGTYVGEFDAREPGNYIANLAYRAGAGEDAIAGSLQTGVSIAYSDEYRNMKTNYPLLNELANLTGGRVLSPSQAASVFDTSTLPRAESRRAIWEDLIRWMLVLFLLDVAVRRIAFNPREAARKLRKELAGVRHSGAASAATLSTLKETREKVREDFGARGAAPQEGRPPDRAARYEAPTPDAKVTEDLNKALDGASELDAPVVARPTGKKPAIDEADYTSRLLRAKRRARDDMKKKDE